MTTPPTGADRPAAALLDVRDLAIGFQSTRPVQGVSFSVAPGETVAIVGESGSGKSLTALALMRLLPRTARILGGEAHLSGTDLLSAPERQIRALRGRHMAMIFQEPMTSLNPIRTIGWQIIEALRQHEDLTAAAARRRAIELLDLVRLPDPHLRIDDPPHRLSGGMRQRVMIAMAISCGPSLLIADEPTTALDVTIQAEILDLLDRLRRDLSMGLLLITHDLDIVAQWADRVVVMYAGRQVEQADPGPLFELPLHPYTRGLLAASPRAAGGAHYRDAPLPEIAGSIASAAGQQGCAFAPRCPAVKPACRLAAPPLAQVAPGRYTACPVAASAMAANPSSPERPHAAVAGF